MDVAGLAAQGPAEVVAPFIDAASAGVSLLRGDYTGAGLSGMAAIPVVGSVFNAAKIAKGTGAAEREATGFLGRSGSELKNAPYQNVRNEPTTINGRDYSGHSLDQMQNRGVMPSVVENTINTGKTFPTRPGTTGYYDSVNNVRVIVNSETGRVVTTIRGAP